MVDYKYSELYKQESVDKQLNIAFDGGNITNIDIHSEQFELTESLCSDSQLRFGSCEASMIKFRISNIFTPLKDKWLTVTETLNHNTDIPFQFGKYKVYSDTPTADRRYRDVVAYDKMYDIINTDLTDWYNSLFTTDDTEMTLKEFRTSLMSYLGVEQEDVTLVNDDMVIKKTIQPTQLAGGDVVSAICEINGCFGHIGRDGKFHYVFLSKCIQGLYPSNDLYPKDDLFPREQITNKIDKSLYIDCKYEDYLSQKITKIQIRQEENDIGKTYPDGNVTDNDNVYSVTDNFLVYGKEETELDDIAKKLYSVIYGTEYRPYEAEVVGNPCFEVGDAVRFNTTYQIVESYVLNRTLKGVQGLRDSFSADGEEYYTEKVNAFETQITQLKGKTNTLERNVEETRSTIRDVEQGLETQIKQTSDSITSTVSKQITETKQYADNVASNAETNAKNDTTEKLKSYSTTTEMNSAIEQTAESITSTVSATYETKTDASKMKKELQTSIEQTDQNITQTVSTTYETKTDASATKKELSSQIEQTAESITSIVASAQSKWDTTGYTIDFYGYGFPSISAEENPQKIYLDQSTGKLYKPRKTSVENPYFWYNFASLELITDELSSRIEQTISSISLEINNGDKTAGIVITLENEDGSTSEVTGTIEMTGMVTFNDLKGEGQTVINGSNIITGKINCDLLDGGTINGQTIRGSYGEFTKGFSVLVPSEYFRINSGSIGYMGGSGENSYLSYGTGGLSLVNDIRGMYFTCGNGDFVFNDSGKGYKMYISRQTVIQSLSVSGTKSRIASTKNYNDRLLYCYEMPSPLFGDIGHGVIGNDGLCYVDIDSIFAETIDTIQQYYVFLQPYSDKPLYIKEKTENYFVVCGEPNTEFDWEIKAKQSDFPMERLEENSDDEFSDIDYVSSAEKYLENYEKELTV